MNANRIANIIGDTITDYDQTPSWVDDMYVIRADQLFDICADAADRIVKDDRERKAREHGQRG